MISASPDLIAWGWRQVERETCLFLRQTATSLSGPRRRCTNNSLRIYNRAPGPNLKSNAPSSVTSGCWNTVKPPVRRSRAGVMALLAKRLLVVLAT
jgi:hypothetical protein